MGINKYLLDARVIKEINETKKYFEENDLKVSDIYDSNNNQYVDLVQEGGGVLGIGLIGYTYALEELGIRFYNLAGTSAGSINASFLAAIGSPNEKKSVKILEILEAVNLMDFVDGGSDAEAIVKKIADKKSFSRIALSAMNQIDDFFIRKELGVNRGDVFLEWLKEMFSNFGISTTSDIIDRMNDFKLPISCRDNVDYEKKAKLAIVASDITTQTKAEFPRMSSLYFAEPETVNPAYYVRASMSIPIFFDPLIIENIPLTKKHVEEWQKIESAYFFGNIPEKAVLVDGGIMSNFPIDIFHVDERSPVRPTFGVKLGYDRMSTKKNDSIISIIWNSFSAARQMRDHEVLIKNQDYINLIANIDDDGIDWLNFNLPQEGKIELFARGVEAACLFIREFKWDEYKELRGKLLKTSQEHNFGSSQAKYAQNFIRKMK